MSVQNNVVATVSQRCNGRRVLAQYSEGVKAEYEELEPINSLGIT